MKNYSNFLKEEEKTQNFKIAVERLSGEYQPVKFNSDDSVEETFETKEDAIKAINNFVKSRSGHVNKPKVYKIYCNEEELNPDESVDSKEKVYVVEPFKNDDDTIDLKGKWCSQKEANEIVSDFTLNKLSKFKQ